MIQGPQLIIVLVIVLLLFGGSKLPKLARGLGEAQKEFRQGLKEGEEPAPPASNASTNTATGTAASADSVPRTTSTDGGDTRPS